MDRQRMAVPAVRADGIRRGNSLGGAVADLPRVTVGGQAAAMADDPRYPGAANDSQIQRDRTAWFPTDSGPRGVGTGTVNWSLCAPPRPELHVRNVTYRRMAGTSQTRALTNPLDPTVGLHSQTPHKPSGNLERYVAGGQTIKPGRLNRLSPARYAGQSYSQTTLLQGASSSSSKGRRRR